MDFFVAVAPVPVVTGSVPAIERWVTLAVGLLIGLCAGWLLRSLRKSTPDARVEGELRQQLAARESELGAVRTEVAQAGAARAAAEASRAAAEQATRERAEELESGRQELAGIRERLAGVEAELVGARKEAEKCQALLAEQRRFHDDSERELRENHARIVAELRASHDRALAELRDAFKALSSDALRQSAPEFLRLAGESFQRFQETARGELALREEKIATLVKPLEEQLKVYQQRLQQAESSQTGLLGEVTKHLQQLTSQSQTLSSETQRLRVVLSSNQARGRWGEETLRRVVEAAGLSPHCDFTEQATSDGNDSKPDLIIHLPGDRMIIVDSKVPDLDFLSALNTADETKRAEALAAHARKLRDTIRQLAERDYPGQFPNALDHVVLFLPAESLFSAALEGDHELIVWAAQRRIMLATPASLIALLRSVAITWQQNEQSQNARQIVESAQELYSRVSTFVSHFERIRDGLTKANKAYDDAVGSFERSVRPSGERLVKLGGGSPGKELAEIRPLEASLRLPPA